MKRTTAALLALLAVAGPAQALIVSKKVGPLLQEAQAMIIAKNYKGALAKLNEADALKKRRTTSPSSTSWQGIIAASLDPKQPRCSIAGMEITGAVRRQDGITRCDGRAIRAQP